MSQSASQRRLPAEWERQSGVMLTWPHRAGDWGALLADVEPVCFSIAVQIARRESVFINCASASQRDRLRATLLRSGGPPAATCFPGPGDHPDRLFAVNPAVRQSALSDHAVPQGC